MELFLIRHGHAEDRMNWNHSDLLRPLTEKGISRAEKAFSNFIKTFGSPDYIISSKANRAFETGLILEKLCGVKMTKTSALNPGASYDDYFSIIKDFHPDKRFALVGHEPDISEFTALYLNAPNLYIELKKGSIIHIRSKTLINVIQQKILL